MKAITFIVLVLSFTGAWGSSIMMFLNSLEGIFWKGTIWKCKAFYIFTLLSWIALVILIMKL